MSYEKGCRQSIVVEKTYLHTYEWTNIPGKFG